MVCRTAAGDEHRRRCSVAVAPGVGSRQRVLVGTYDMRARGGGGSPGHAALRKGDRVSVGLEDLRPRCVEGGLRDFCVLRGGGAHPLVQEVASGSARAPTLAELCAFFFFVMLAAVEAVARS